MEEDFALDIHQRARGPLPVPSGWTCPTLRWWGRPPGGAAFRPPRWRDRFGVILRLELYSPQELCTIAQRSARILGIPLRAGGPPRCWRGAPRGTPRIGQTGCSKGERFSQVVGTGASPPEAAGLALDRQDIDHFWGLDPLDRRMLTLMIQNYAGGPVGLDTLAAAWVRNR